MKTVRFTKMHGLGNDFVVFDGVSQGISMSPVLARKLADRHLGIGCDQILLVEPPTTAHVDFQYRIFNADGSEVAQCGNGARCFAKFVHDQKLTGKKMIRVETKAGIMDLRYEDDNNISVVMGVPRFEPAAIPLQREQRQTIYSFDIDGITYKASALSLGNPHVVLRVDNIARAPVAELGRILESHEDFPDKVNVGFMEIRSRTELAVRVFERGAGETQACGSGACAAVVAGVQQDLLDSPISVQLTGGQLKVAWPGEGQAVTMTGPATTVFHGRIKI